jgi:hypothetical protein
MPEPEAAPQRSVVDLAREAIEDHDGPSDGMCECVACDLAVEVIRQAERLAAVEAADRRFTAEVLHFTYGIEDEVQAAALLGLVNGHNAERIAALRGTT